jgi:MFS family permease
MTGRPASYRDLLTVADLPALLTATFLSRLADRMLSLAIVLYALTRFASPALAGWLTFAAVTPGLIISPLAGALLDRIGSAWAVTVDMAASATLILVLVAMDQSDRANAGTLLVLMGLFSLTSPLSAAGVRTLLPRLVPTDALDRANALDTAIHAVADVLGPALAGLLAGVIGPALTLTIIAVAYGAAAVSVARVHRVPDASLSQGSLLRETVEGIRLVVNHATLRGLAVSYALYQMTWGVLVIVVPVLAAHSLAIGARDVATGLLWAAAGVAGGVGALAAGRYRTTGRERRVMAVGMFATAVGAWPVAATFGLPGLVVGLMIAGIAAGPIDVGLLTLRQRRTDPAQLGRVLAISMSLNLSGFPIGSAFAGMLITRSLPGTLAIAGFASALAVITVRLVPNGNPLGAGPVG